MVCPGLVQVEELIQDVAEREEMMKEQEQEHVEVCSCHPSTSNPQLLIAVQRTHRLCKQHTWNSNPCAPRS